MDEKGAAVSDATGYEAVTLATPKDRFVVVAVETMHRTYSVEAETPEKAKQRLRRYFTDPDMVAPGIVRPEGEGERVRWLIRDDKKAKPKT